MDNKKYIGMDVHQATISVAVRDSAGKLVMESVMETKATTIQEFIRGLRGSLWVTFEEGTSAAWLYDLLKPEVAEVLVCNPRQNALLRAGNKNDRVNARKLSGCVRGSSKKPTRHCSELVCSSRRRGLRMTSRQKRQSTKGAWSVGDTEKVGLEQ